MFKLKFNYYETKDLNIFLIYPFLDTEYHLVTGFD